MHLSDVIVSIIIEIARVIIIYFYFKTFLKCTNKIKHLCTCVMSFIITAGCYIVFNNVIINIISTVIGVLIISLAFKGNLKSKFLLSILCCSIMIIIDAAAYYMLENKGNEDVYNVAASFLSILLFYIVTFLLRLIIKKREETEFTGHWYILFVVSVMSVSLLICVYRNMTFQVYEMLYTSTTLLVLNFLLYIFYINMLDRYTFFKENEQLKQQMNMYEIQMKANMENDKKIRAIRHDMKHHMREIGVMADNGNINDIKAYIKEFVDDVKKSETVYNTGNVMLDGILNYYVSIFKQKSIKYEIKVVIPENLEMNMYDMNIVFGNLFDNVIENVVESDNPLVVVDIKYLRHILSISIANTYDGKIKKIDGVLFSRKNDKHGYGLGNVRRIAEKYNGNVKVEYNYSMFIAGVVMYI